MARNRPIKFITAAGLVALAAAVAYYATTAPRTESLLTVADGANPPAPAMAPEVDEKRLRTEQYMTQHVDRLAELSTNPAFMGEETDTHPAKAPASSVQMMDGFKVKVPELSEAIIEEAIYREQLSYTLANLSPPLLDGMMDGYQHEFATLLTEMGLKRDCAGAQCGYRIDEGAFLDTLKASGFESGDVILALNNTQVRNINGYDTFKQVVFNHADQLEFSVARKGEVKVLQVPVHASQLN